MAETCGHCNTTCKDIDDLINHLETTHHFNVSKEAKFARKA